MGLSGFKAYSVNLRGSISRRETTSLNFIVSIFFYYRQVI
jgi:hypothetical protein